MGPSESTFFTQSEFDCKCGRSDCDAAPMQMEVVAKLNGVRRELGEPIHLTSARRCELHNRAVGGAKNSLHLYGLAVDIRTPNAEYAMRLMRLLIKHGFVGVGISKTFIHGDCRHGPSVLFAYKC